MRATWWKGYPYRETTVSSLSFRVKESKKKKKSPHLFPLKCSQSVLDLVVLGVFRANIIVDTGSFLQPAINLTNTKHKHRVCDYLLQ